MIRQCDYMVAAAPLTEETRGMMGEAEFRAMKPDAVVINLGRGPVIDEAAMVRALTEKRIKGAGLDVFDSEPLPEGHPFYSLENVLLSPHCADHTADWTQQAMLFFLAQWEKFTAGETVGQRGGRSSRGIEWHCRSAGAACRSAVVQAGALAKNLGIPTFRTTLEACALGYHWCWRPPWRSAAFSPVRPPLPQRRRRHRRPGRRFAARPPHL